MMEIPTNFSDMLGIIPGNIPRGGGVGGEDDLESEGDTLGDSGSGHGEGSGWVTGCRV